MLNGENEKLGCEMWKAGKILNRNILSKLKQLDRSIMMKDIFQLVTKIFLYYQDNHMIQHNLIYCRISKRK